MDENTSSSIEGSFKGDAMGGHGESCGRFLPWRPMDLAFRRYGKTESSDGLRVAVRKSIVSQLTNDIVQTYQLCSPNFKHSETFNPKRYLTSPHVGVSNGGFDNVNSDLILSVNFSLINEESQRRYVIKEMLGHGTFGQVAKCWVPDKNEFVAVKVIKNQPAYYHQAIHEVTILRTLNQNFDPENKHHIVRMLEFFVFRCHLCISFEMLGPHLYDLLQLNNLKGLRMNFVQMFSKQILHALVVMKNAGIVHCDMKPENILVWTSVKPKGVKVIDFGSACKEGHTVYSYIQSRYYRSPEVLLGYPYNTAIDMWSFGCIVAELFLGLPLFPGLSEYDVLRRMIKILGGQPPDIILRNAKKTTKFFKHVGSIHRLDDNQVFHGNDRAYCFLTEAEYEAREQVKPAVGKWYFNHVKLRDIIAGHPYKSNLPEEEKSKEKLIRLALIDFVKGLIEFDPEKRWTPLQASGHPFVTGEPFTEPYCPPPVTYNSSVVPNIRVDYKADRGHWVASGFSPQVMHMSRNVQHSSPHMMPSFRGTGYGSYGSYNDNQHLVGSYGDTNKAHERSSVGSSGSSIPMHIVGSTLGASPYARSVPLYSYGSGFAMSPTETFRPFPLGVSPSQFTLPRSQIQVSNVSPGKYDPTSPAKGSSYGSLLGKVAAAGQYNKGSLGYPGTVSMQHSQGASQHWGAHQLDDSLPEQIFLGFIGSPHSAQFAQSSWQQERDANEIPSGLPLLNNRSMHLLQQGNRDDALHSSGSSSHPEGVPSPLHPGDWDPNYSEVDVQAPRYFHTQSSQSSVLDIHSGYNHPKHSTHQVSHFSQSSPSHFAQQPAHRYDQQSFLVDGDMNCPNMRLINYTYNSEDPRPPAYSASGQRSGYPIATTSPANRSRNNYWRIS